MHSQNRKPRFVFALRTLLIVVTLTAVAIVAFPHALRCFDWYKSREELRAFAKTDFLEYGYEDTLAAAKPHFDRLISELAGLGPYADEKEKLALIKACVDRLNNLANSNFAVETPEREEFCKTLGDIAEQARLIETGDRAGFYDQLLDWRDW